MTEDERLNHTYLGDGVYAESTPEHIILRANDHRDEHCTDKIYLEQSVLVDLIFWLVTLKRINKPSIIQHVDLQSLFDKLGQAVGQIMIDALEDCEKLITNEEK